MLLKKIFFIFDQKHLLQVMYAEAAVGKNTLSVIVKDMCAETGIGKKTNHSLQVLVPC